MECRCEKEDAGDAVADLWLNGRNLGMGVFVFVGSVALSALIQWAARFFCSTAGLYWLWGRMSMKNIRRIQSLLQWLCRMTSFLSALTCGLWWIFTFIRGFRKGSSESPKAPDSDLTSSTTKKPKLRLVLLGPSGGGRTSLVETLLGSRNGETEAPGAPLLQSTKFTVDGEELIVVDTPDLLGTSLEDGVRATEALRALQLTRPGPHAFLLVLPAPGSSTDDDQDAAQAAKAALQLFGEEASEHILPVVTHADRLGRNPTVDRLMETEGWKSALDLCGQSPELVDNRPGLELEAQRELRRKLLERGMDMKELRGHFVHELQRREDLLREELLADMSSALAGKLGQV